MARKKVYKGPTKWDGTPDFRTKAAKAWRAIHGPKVLPKRRRSRSVGGGFAPTLAHAEVQTALG